MVRPDEYDMPYPQYTCPVCGKELPLGDARVTVTCAQHAPAEKLDFEVREAMPDDRREIERICDQAWGETEVDAFGRTFDVLASDNLLAEAGGKLLGMVSLSVYRGEAVVVMLSVYPEHQGSGVGRALTSAAADRAASRGLPSLRAAVSNDDIPSLYFYQRQGFVIDEIVVGAMADRLGSVAAGFAGIPVRDEIRLRRPLAR